MTSTWPLLSNIFWMFDKTVSSCVVVDLHFMKMADFVGNFVYYFIEDAPLQDIWDYWEEGDGSVVFGCCFQSFFKNGHNIGTFSFSWYDAFLDGLIEQASQWGNEFSGTFFQDSGGYVVWAGSLIWIQGVGGRLSWVWLLKVGVKDSWLLVRVGCILSIICYYCWTGFRLGPVF